MLIIYPFSTVDQDQALKNAKWIAELGEYKSHDMLVMCDRRCDPDIMRQVVETFASVFRIAKHRLTTSDVDGWPEGANQLFSLATTLIQHEQAWPYFLWLEPDAIPMVPGWLDKLEAEYKRAGKPFMGDRVQVGDIPLHMSGVGIYQNPIYLLAGECYRAHDTAWDMAAKDQIVPRAHFTDLIEHAWKHPTFKDQFELNTQIAKETILFHSSKDGSLIDLLRQKAAPVLNHNSVPTEPTSGSPSREEIGTRAVQPIYDIFIRTYPGDYEWLFYCLRSIDKFCTGFRKIWIVSPDKPEIGPRSESWLNLKRWGDFVEWKVMNDETEDGYLAQQITKLYADVITSYQADYILHVDSDVIFSRPVTPQDFFQDGKMIWYYTPYESIQTPWQPIIEKFMGFPQPYEFMRRLPIMVPLWLYPRVREFCHRQHGRIISEYIRTQPMREFSEFNVLGAYAYFNARDKIHWRHTQEEGPMPAPLARQFHSWSGLTPEVKTEIETILGGKNVETNPSVEGTVHEQASLTHGEAAPAQINKLPSGIWVLHGDQISDWVIQEGRLDHDQNLLPDILKHINPGDTVVDAGAFIGDHTIAYSNAVGEKGWVIAFEPNPVARKCLQHNLKKHHNVTVMDYGLSDQHEHVPLSGNNGNYGGCYIGNGQQIATVEMYALDTRQISKLEFIKIDVEGYELKVLRGAKKTIEKYKPRMVIEVNIEALRRQGTHPNELLTWLDDYGYNTSIIQTNATWTDPLFDILAIAKQPPEISSGGGSAHTESVAVAPSVAAFQPTTKEEIEWHIGVLKQFCETSPQTKGLVMQKLVYAGLRLPNKKTKYAKTNKQTNWKRKSPFD